MYPEDLLIAKMMSCPVCGKDIRTVGNIREHLRKHRKKGYCLVCGLRRCTCMSPEEAVKRYPKLKEMKCYRCYHFWQQCYRPERTSRLYVKVGWLWMVQACGLVEDYPIFLREPKCDMFEEVRGDVDEAKRLYKSTTDL